ncbi:MAG: EMC3/TMCO1 family protein [Candidatus Micrarchaeia archaeon]
MFFSIEPVYAVFAIGVAYYVASNFIMGKIVDRKKMNDIQEESKRLQKELNEASKKNDTKRLEEINKEYEKFMPKMLSMSFMQLKPLIIIIPALAILTPWLRGQFSEFIIKLPFSLPIFIQSFEKFPNWRDTFGAVGWFWICVLATSLAISLIKAVYNKLNKQYGFSLKAFVPDFGFAAKKAADAKKDEDKKIVSELQNPSVVQQPRKIEQQKNKSEEKSPPAQVEKSDAQKIDINKINEK